MPRRGRRGRGSVRRARVRRRTSRAGVPKRTSRAKVASKEVRSETNTEQQAIAEAHRLLAKWKVPGYTAAFSNRMTSSMGKVNHRTKVITFSRPLWERASPSERKETVIHEIAHAVVAHFHGRKPGVSHGKEWKRQMRAMGIRNPRRTHAVSRAGLKRTRSDTISVTCCGVKHRITLKRLARIGGTGGRCRCKGGGTDEIRFATKADRDRFERYMAAALTPNVCMLDKGRG